MTKPLYLFDLDGTLANLGHRLHHVKDGNSNWKQFYADCVRDSPILEMIELTHLISGAGAEIWIVSGRSDEVEAETAYWLEAFGVAHDALLMRRAGDYRPDYEIKQEMLNNMLDVDRERIVMAFDDRDQVVQMWRNNGIRCLQVAPGASERLNLRKGNIL